MKLLPKLNNVAGRRVQPLLIVTAIITSLLLNESFAQTPDSLLSNRLNTPTSRVSPALEIEILDPNTDARGNPAILMKTDESGSTQLDIPPTLLVHRYYYTGDRSFRGPAFPGGPTIVITQNPVDGSQVYLPVQMLPGSPIVHYSARSIEYDFGNRAVIVTFPKLGAPLVSYRNGRPVKEKASKLLGIDKMQAVWQHTKSGAETFKAKTETVVQASGIAASSLARPFTLPIQNLARLIPGQAALSDPDLEVRIKEQVALNDRQQQLDKAAAQNRLDELDLPISP